MKLLTLIASVFDTLSVSSVLLLSVLNTIGSRAFSDQWNFLIEIAAFNALHANRLRRCTLWYEVISGDLEHRPRSVLSVIDLDQNRVLP